MSRIGIMQGRLVPPADNRIQCFPRNKWRDEFELASKAGLECIEWIYDLYGADVNPIATDPGLQEMRQISAKHNISITSVCADYFMEKTFLRVSKNETENRIKDLFWLIQRCQMLGADRIVLPFVDASCIESEAELDLVCSLLEQTLPVAFTNNVELHLETSLPPDTIATILAKLHHPMLKVNYDSGNSSSLGFHPNNEFTFIGTQIGSVHIKDRIFGGGTVPLGTGDADFSSLFENLKRVHFTGDYILQVARGDSGDELNWTKSNLEFINQYMV